jgi:alkylhydroperoxidase/carboxymuconolactone decarboxylase family protein YurZ
LGLDDKSKSLARVAALLAHDGSAQTFRWTVGDALDAGWTPDEIVRVLLAIAPLIGMATIVNTAPKVALALDYDLDSALHSLEP